MPNPNTKGISVHVDRELHAEITAYLQENNMKMGDFISLAAQNLLRPPSMGLDPELQSEIDAYLEDHDMASRQIYVDFLSWLWYNEKIDQHGGECNEFQIPM